jgi:hypothetical protein
MLTEKKEYWVLSAPSPATRFMAHPTAAKIRVTGYTRFDKLKVIKSDYLLN